MATRFRGRGSSPATAAGAYGALGVDARLGSGTGVLVSEDLSALTGGGELPAGERSISCGEENSRILAATPLVGEGVWPRRTPKAGDMSPIVFVAPPRILIRFTLGLTGGGISPVIVGLALSLSVKLRLEIPEMWPPLENPLWENPRPPPEKPRPPPPPLNKPPPGPDIGVEMLLQ